LESSFLPKLKDRAEEYGDFSESRQRWYLLRDLQYTNATSKTFAFDIFGISDVKAEEAIREAAPTCYSGACRAVFKADAKEAGATRWANKTPKYVRHIRWLAEAFPNAHFVHILRDPRDVSASLIRAGWHSTYREAGRYWLRQVRAGRKAGDKLRDERYIEVYYEDLVLNPVDEIEKLSEWIGIELGEQALQYRKTAEEKISEEHRNLFPLIGKPIDSSRAYAWKRERSESNIADVENVTGSLMEDLGYELSEAEVPVYVLGARWASKKAVSAGRLVKRKLRMVS
jgi:hypothetical protein